MLGFCVSKAVAITLIVKVIESMCYRQVNEIVGRRSSFHVFF